MGSLALLGGPFPRENIARPLDILKVVLRQLQENPRRLSNLIAGRRIRNQVKGWGWYDISLLPTLPLDLLIEVDLGFVFEGVYGLTSKMWEASIVEELGRAYPTIAYMGPGHYPMLSRIADTVAYLGPESVEKLLTEAITRGENE